MDPTGLLFLVAAAAAFYFLIIRPQRQRQRQQAQMIAAIQPGTEIITTAGMYATVAVVTEDQVSLEVSPGVYVRMVPQAISKVIEPAGAQDADAAVDADPADEPGAAHPGADTPPPVD